MADLRGRTSQPVSRVLQLVTSSPDETQRVATAVAAALRPGDVVALTGELGAGKTCFVQGAARALGVRERVTSPSFVLRREYSGRDLPLLHLDVYRLERLHEVVDLGWDEALDGRHVTFVEWGDAMRPLLPTDHLEVELRLPPLDAAGDGADDERRVALRAHGDTWQQRLVDLEERLSRWRAQDASVSAPEA